MPTRLADNTSNRTAAITGASSGIGQVFAERLAAAGYDLTIIARRENRLQELAADLHHRYGVAIGTHAADLSKVGDVEDVAARLADDPRLELLVNNAGFGTMGDFKDVAPRLHREMIHVHVNATMSLIHAVLPGMIDRNRGDIINVASMSAFLITPGSATYAATKAFVKSFSDSLNAELAGTGVRVQSLCPGMTYTEFHDTDQFRRFDRRQISPALWMSAEDVVEASLRALDRGKEVCIPGYRNRVLAFLFHIRPIKKLAGRAVRKKATREPITT